MSESTTAADSTYHRHLIRTETGKTDQEMTSEKGHKPTEEDLNAIAQAHLSGRSPVTKRKWLLLSQKVKCFLQLRVVSTCLHIKCERS
jgi:hypothetical protein